MSYIFGIGGSQYSGECGDRAITDDDAAETIKNVKQTFYPDVTNGFTKGDVVSFTEDYDGLGGFEWVEVVDTRPDSSWDDSDPGDDNGNGRWLYEDSDGKRYLVVTFYLTPGSV